VKRYRLTGADGSEYLSAEPGTIGGHKGTRIFGRLDCPSALRAIAKGVYVSRRVFFADEETAVAAGYRPCAVCLPKPYEGWLVARARRKERHGSASETSTAT
jgi:methylphosphotriester-DNA--protein-cysteine methyltransferase